ncbi:hypothetical protein [Roseateles sp.]|uniref:hypothetical protein n=1 Tax=Roseateles sp. TaxID=1971397 RepID=UPI0032645D91
MKPVQQLLVAASLAPLLIATPVAQAASAATGIAQIDWSSVAITPLSGTQYSVVGHEATVMFANNVALPVSGGTPYEVGASDTTTDAPRLHAQHLDPGLGRLLMGQVDIGEGQQIASQYARVGVFGERFDASNSTWALLLHSDAGGQIHVTGNYLLSLSATATLPGDSAYAVTFADIKLYDPSAGLGLFEDYREQVLSVGLTGQPHSGLRAVAGSFDDLITLPAGQDVKLFFTTSAGATLAAAPVPEPDMQALLAVGLAGMWLLRRLGAAS